MDTEAPETAFKVVFLRHGESTWNKSNQFTGWTDVPLTEQGDQEGKMAGQILKDAGYKFDVAHTLVLKRAILTYNHVADITDHHYIPVYKSYRLNERHYGSLQGLNKAETLQKHGEEQVLIWRRSYDVPPPTMESDDPNHPQNDEKYSHLPKSCLPNSESLEMTLDRVMPYWEDQICPMIKEGKKVIVVAHGNSLRAIVKHLSKMSNEDVVKYNIPTGIPFVYEFDKDLNPIKDYYLLDEEELKAKQEAVANQAKAG